MSNLRGPASQLPVRDPRKPAPSGEYRMVTPRAPRRIAGEYLDTRHGPIATTSSKKPIAQLDDAFDDAFTFGEDDDSFPEENAPEAPDSLVEMMEGIEGTRVKEEAWPKEKPMVVPRPPSVPKMEAMQPTLPLQVPISRATPRPLNEHQIIEDFAKFGPSPESIWQTPAYAFHVRARKEQLKRELGLHRERRAADVELFEKALRHVDDDAVRRGWMMMAGAAGLLVLVIAIVCVLL